MKKFYNVYFDSGNKTYTAYQGFNSIYDFLHYIEKPFSTVTRWESIPFNIWQWWNRLPAGKKIDFHEKLKESRGLDYNFWCSSYEHLTIFEIEEIYNLFYN